MDANKDKKLEEVGYVVHPTCDLCVHSQFPIGSDWGTCQIHTYDHKKHNEKKRFLSIYRSGSCPSFKLDKTRGDSLAGYSKYLKIKQP